MSWFQTPLGTIKKKTKKNSTARSSVTVIFFSGGTCALLVCDITLFCIYTDLTELLINCTHLIIYLTELLVSCTHLIIYMTELLVSCTNLGCVPQNHSCCPLALNG